MPAVISAYRYSGAAGLTPRIQSRYPRSGSQAKRLCALRDPLCEAEPRLGRGAPTYASKTSSAAPTWSDAAFASVRHSFEVPSNEEGSNRLLCQ